MKKRNKSSELTGKSGKFILQTTNVLEKNVTMKTTINDIARLAGVSKATVSYYLNGKIDKMSAETAETIRTAIEQTGYVPSHLARSLSARHTKMLGVVIGDVTNSFSSQVLKGIDSYASTKGYQMILGSSDYIAEKESNYLHSMNAMDVDGFIIQPTIRFAESGFESDKPLVMVDSPTEGSTGLWVKTDNVNAVRDGLGSMLARGYERYVMVIADTSVLAARMERYQGFMQFIGENHLRGKVIIADDSTPEKEIRDQIGDFRNESTLVFVGNGWLTPKVCSALAEYRHLIPRQLGILGFDSFSWASLVRPSISTIEQPAFEEGEMAARILIERIEGRKDTPSQMVLRSTLRERESTDKQ